MSGSQDSYRSRQQLPRQTVGVALTRAVGRWETQCVRADVGPTSTQDAERLAATPQTMVRTGLYWRPM